MWRTAALGLAAIAIAVGTAGSVAAAPTDHVKTAGTLSAELVGRKSANTWIVEIKWTGACSGADEPWYDGHIYVIDVDTGAREFIRGVVDTSGQRSVSHTIEWWAFAKPRAQRLRFELTDYYCYEHFPLHGGTRITVPGNAVIIPPRFGSGSGGTRGTGDYGSGDPTSPLASGGCTLVLMGSDRPDTIRGRSAGDIVFGRGGGDRVDGVAGHDCLIGEQGNDRLTGGSGNDRLTGGRGNDVLIGGSGANSFDGGPGNDRVDARNGVAEVVLCGSGRDRVRADALDRLRDCERVE